MKMLFVLIYYGRTIHILAMSYNLKQI